RTKKAWRMTEVIRHAKTDGNKCGPTPATA
ncbi:MAG: hypothetical protein ACI8P0_006099, partial [Planctomycetaceae bacterium]